MKAARVCIREVAKRGADGVRSSSRIGALEFKRAARASWRNARNLVGASPAYAVGCKR
jgi:hypothetical protein